MNKIKAIITAIKMAIMATIGIIGLVIGKKLEQGKQAKKDLIQTKAEQETTTKVLKKAKEVQDEANKKKSEVTSNNVINKLNELSNTSNK
jgi:F420-0:gamma-glutamyl ligase-like protein